MKKNGGSCLGIRAEDKNMWERRVPLTPEHVRSLVKQGLRVIVEPSTRRIYGDQAYVAAGAEMSTDLSPASTIFAVKEVNLIFYFEIWIL